jgi:polysaccharide export outer membrane protein
MNKVIYICSFIRAARSPRLRKPRRKKLFHNAHIAFWLIINLLTVFTVNGTEAKTYRIGVGDVLHISVWGQSDLDKHVTVFDDGTILFPLIGQVSTKGLTVIELTNNITRLLEKDYLVNPQVNINIAEYNSQHVYILGSVYKPGLYPLKGETTVLEAVTMAGGITSEAGKKLLLIKLSVKDIRQGKRVENLLEKRKSRHLDLHALLNHGDLSQNPPVEADDVIFIPPAQEAADSSVYITGEIQRPGSYTFKDGLTALKLCITAGGFTDISAPNRAEVIRTVKDGKQKIIRIDLEEVNEGKIEDFALLPGDRIVIPESYF